MGAPRFDSASRNHRRIKLERQLALAQFVAGKISQAVVRSVLVHFRERRKIEDELDEGVDLAAEFQHHHAGVNQFGGALADDVHAEQFAVAALKDELQQASGIAGHSAAGVVGIAGAPDLVFDFLLLARFLGFAHSGNFRNGIDTHGKLGGDAFFVVEAEGMADGHTALFHRGGCERGKADYVSRGIDGGHGSLVRLVHVNVAALIQGQPNFFEAEPFHRAAASRSEQSRIGLEHFSGLQLEAHAALHPLRLRHALFEEKVDAETSEAFLKKRRQLTIEKRKHTVTAIHERNFDTNGGEDRSVFAANHTTPDDNETLGDTIHFQDGIGIEDTLVVEWNFGGPVGARARGNQDKFAAQ